VAVLANFKHLLEADQVQPDDSLYLAPRRMHEYNEHDNGKPCQRQTRRECFGIDLRATETIYRTQEQYMAETG
jgi:hypothetical protein